MQILLDKTFFSAQRKAEAEEAAKGRAKEAKPRRDRRKMTGMTPAHSALMLLFTSLAMICGGGLGR